MKKLLLPFLLLSLSVVGQEKTCKGTTKAGKPCKSAIVSKSGFCRSHDPQAIKCAGTNAAGKPCGMTVKTKGDKCRFHAK